MKRAESRRAPVLAQGELESFLRAEFPQVLHAGSGLSIEDNLSINFLRRPGAADLLAEARLTNLGKQLAVGAVEIWSAGSAELVAHATSTYSIPRQ